MITLDAIDEQLARLLTRNARQSSSELAKQLSLSPATVRRRVARLINNGIIEVVAVVDPVKVGLHVAVVVGLQVDRDRVTTVMDSLARLREVRWVSATTGQFDVIAVLRFRSTEELAVFLREHLSQSQGIRRSETFVCLDIMKGLPRLPDASWLRTATPSLKELRSPPRGMRPET